MSKAIVYTLPDCPNCEQAKDRLKTMGYEIEVRDVEALTRGEIVDIEAMAELNLNNGSVPVIVIDDQAVAFGSELHRVLTRI